MDKDLGVAADAAALAGSALSPFGSSPSAPAANAQRRPTVHRPGDIGFKVEPTEAFIPPARITTGDAYLDGWTDAYREAQPVIDDLLAALKGALAADSHEAAQAALDAAEAAIAKAEGSHD